MSFLKDYIHLSLLLLIFTKNISESSATGNVAAQPDEQFQKPLSAFRFGTAYVPSALKVKICPPENPNEKIFDNNYPQYKCNFAHIHRTYDFKCSSPLFPILVEDYDFANKYKCATWTHHVCSIKYKSKTTEKELDIYEDSKEDKELTLDEMFALKIYTFCTSNEQEDDTIFTKHMITTNRSSDRLVGLPNLELKEYKEENQKEALEIIYNTAEINGKDFLRPQMLSPSNEIVPDLSRKTYHLKYNIKPQWDSLYTLWNDITMYIWYALDTRNWIAINFNGATGTTKVNGQEVRIGKYTEEDDKSDKIENFETTNLTQNEAETETTNKLKQHIVRHVPTLNSGPQRIPTHWWRLIHVQPDKNILIVMHNTALGAYQPTISRICPKSVCQNYGWKGVIKYSSDYQYATVYCCEVTEETLNNLGVLEITEKIQIGRPLILSLVGDDSKFINNMLKSADLSNESSIEEDSEPENDSKNVEDHQHTIDSVSAKKLSQEILDLIYNNPKSSNLKKEE